MLQKLIFICFILLIKVRFGVPTNILNLDKLTTVKTPKQVIEDSCEVETNDDFIFQFENLTGFLLEERNYQENIQRFSDQCSMCRNRQQSSYSAKPITSKFIIDVKEFISHVPSELEKIWSNYHNMFCEIEELERCTKKKYILEFSSSEEQIRLKYKDSGNYAEFDRKPWPEIMKIILTVSEFYFGIASLEFENKLLQLTVPGVVKTKTIVDMLGDLKKIIIVEKIHPLSSFKSYPICQKYRNILKKGTHCPNSVRNFDEKKYNCTTLKD